MESERIRMKRGELYDAGDVELVEARLRARRLLEVFNKSHATEVGRRAALLEELFGEAGADLWIEPPFFCDYGSNIFLGKRVFINFNCVVLDPAEVHLGDNVLLGPAVQIYTASHPLDHRVRARGQESALPIRIESDVWLGGGAILLPGASVGARSVIGAGSVVSGRVPEGVLAVGNPCRVVRQLE